MLFLDTATIAGNPKEVSAVDEARRKEIKNVLVSANAASRRAATSANFSQRNGRTGRTGVPPFFHLCPRFSFSGIAGLPRSSLYRLTRLSLSPCFTYHSPRSCK